MVIGHQPVEWALTAEDEPSGSETLSFFKSERFESVGGALQVVPPPPLCERRRFLSATQQSADVVK